MCDKVVRGLLTGFRGYLSGDCCCNCMTNCLPESCQKKITTQGLTNYLMKGHDMVATGLS